MTATDLALSVSRFIAAPRAIVYEAWTGHLAEWWAPRPYRVITTETEFRSGGIFRTVLHDSRDASCSHERSGIVLEAVPNDRIVITDALLPGWRPAANPFFVGLFVFSDEGDGTRYVATALHWRPEDNDAHRKMGFHIGWGLAADQLAAVATRLNAARLPGVPEVEGSA